MVNEQQDTAFLNPTTYFARPNKLKNYFFAVF